MADLQDLRFGLSSYEMYLDPQEILQRMVRRGKPWITFTKRGGQQIWTLDQEKSELTVVMIPPLHWHGEGVRHKVELSEHQKMELLANAES